MVSEDGRGGGGGPVWGRSWPGGPVPAWASAAGPVLVGLLVLGATLSMHRWAPGAGRPGLAQELLLAAAFLALVARRRWPGAAYGASCLATVLFLALGGAPGPLLLAPFWGLLSLIAREPGWRSWLPAAALGGGALDLAHLLRGGSPLEAGLFISVWLLVAVMVGLAVTVRRRFAAEVQARARWAQRSRAEEQGRLAAEERLRIARELHDVVGHSLAVISLQAGVAEHLLDSRPQEVRQAVTAIRRVSRQALGELRAELASLRSGTAGEPAAPTPSVGDIPALVGVTQEAGLQIELEQPAGPAAVPAVVGAAAYRIVQEALTNAARHARPGARVRVRVERGPSSLRVEVVDQAEPLEPVPGLTEGHGIAGMRERVAALGGRFEIERRASGVRLWAELPAGRP